MTDIFKATYVFTSMKHYTNANYYKIVEKLQAEVTQAIGQAGENPADFSFHVDLFPEKEYDPLDEDNDTWGSCSLATAERATITVTANKIVSPKKPVPWDHPDADPLGDILKMKDAYKKMAYATNSIDTSFQMFQATMPIITKPESFLKITDV